MTVAMVFVLSVVLDISDGTIKTTEKVNCRLPDTRQYGVTPASEKPNERRIRLDA